MRVPRLYLPAPLVTGATVPLNERAFNHAVRVLRLKPGAPLVLFDGEGQAFAATLGEIGKREAWARVSEALPDEAEPPLRIVLAQGISRGEKMDHTVQKAVELGVARLLPVTTRFTNAERMRTDKSRAHAVEAAEQCGALFVPELAEVQPLERVLAAWPEGRRLIWADESLTGKGSWAEVPAGPAALLIGPEGGFSEDEKARLRGLPFVSAISLGPRILRAETAALAVIVQWQARFGDWQ